MTCAGAAGGHQGQAEEAAGSAREDQDCDADGRDEGDPRAHAGQQPQSSLQACATKPSRKQAEALLICMYALG